MSLARACLRLAAVAALRGQTLAQGRVFDSRIGSIEALAPEQRKPVVAVYTEDQAGEPLSAQNGGPPFRPHVDLVFEVSMVEALFDEQQVITDIGCPVTDGELEALLDVLEQQVRTVLFEDMTLPLAVLFRRAFLRATHFQSLRFREEKTGSRLAYRYIIIKLEVADEPVLEAYDGGGVGLARLPKTFRDIARAWPDGLPEKAVALAMANALPQPAVARGITIGGGAAASPNAVKSVTPAGSNAGNGALTIADRPVRAEPGAWFVRFDTPTTFDVLTPGLGKAAGGVVGEPCRGPIPFTIAPGAKAFAPGDSFIITVILVGPEVGVAVP